MTNNKRNYYLTTLKLEETTGTLEIFPGANTLKIFECTLTFRSTVRLNMRLRTLQALPSPGADLGYLKGGWLRKVFGKSAAN